MFPLLVFFSIDLEVIGGHLHLSLVNPIAKRHILVSTFIHFIIAYMLHKHDSQRQTRTKKLFYLIYIDSPPFSPPFSFTGYYSDHNV